MKTSLAGPSFGPPAATLSLEELIHVYDVRRLLETEAARLGSQRITAQECDQMQAEYELMRAAIAERRVIALLDHDEAMLSIRKNDADAAASVNAARLLDASDRIKARLAAQAEG